MPNTCFWPPRIVNPGNMDEDDFLNKHYFKYVDEKKMRMMGPLWRWDVALQLTKQKTRHLWAVRRGNLHFFTWSCLNGLSERKPRVKEFPNGFWQEDKEAEHLQSSFAFVCSKSAKRKASSRREHLVEKFAKVNTNFGGNMLIDQGYKHTCLFRTHVMKAYSRKICRKSWLAWKRSHV